MNISELSINRPVLATVFSLVILLFGFIGFSRLGVREYPSVDNPIITVQTSYPGANADVIENQITEPLEQNINGIPGIRSLTSVSSQGQSRITVEFELSVPLETAANDVRDKVSRAQRYLPRDCDPPTVTKADADATPILMVAVQSDSRSLLELSEIADLTIKEQLQTINNVSGVEIWGEKRYAMRLWLDPVKMAGHGVTTMDVKSAVDRENVELPSGSIEGNTIELSIRTLGLMHTAEQFNNLIIRTDGQRVVRLRDVGWAELGPRELRSYMKMNGIPMVGVVVIPQPGANHIEIADAVYERVEMMRKDLPDDVVTTYGFDNTRFIRSSINEVVKTVGEAFLLVIIIIFLFLRDWRVTLVPVVVIPVSLIGTFFIMYVCGFSINTHHARRGVGDRTCGRRRDRDGREHIHPRGARDGPERGWHRGGEGDIFCYRIHYHHPYRGLFADSIHVGDDGKAVPRVLARDRRCGGDIRFCGADPDPHALDQDSEKTRAAQLALPRNRTILRGAQ